MITTIQGGQETVQAHVVEEIMQDPIQEEDDVTKDVISQYLPTRKRKPRAKKPNQAQASTSGNGESRPPPRLLLLLLFVELRSASVPPEIICHPTDHVRVLSTRSKILK